MTDWKEWFENWLYSTNVGRGRMNEQNLFLEDLYKAFKARMIEEMNTPTARISLGQALSQIPKEL